MTLNRLAAMSDMSPLLGAKQTSCGTSSIRSSTPLNISSLLLIRSWQYPREAEGPGALAAFIGDQILTDLDQDMMQAAALGVDRDGVVRSITDDVRRIVADEQIIFLIERSHHAMREPRVAIVKHPRMPGPHRAFEDGREAMQGDKGRGSTSPPPTIEFGFDPIVIGPENLVGAYLPGAIAQSGIAGDRSIFTDVGDRCARLQRAVAVNNEA
jgi:hypothetical protein